MEIKLVGRADAKLEVQPDSKLSPMRFWNLLCKQAALIERTSEVPHKSNSEDLRKQASATAEDSGNNEPSSTDSDGVSERERGPTPLPQRPECREKRVVGGPEHSKRHGIKALWTASDASNAVTVRTAETSVGGGVDGARFSKCLWVLSVNAGQICNYDTCRASSQ